jgi:hypothetical protein
MASIDYNEDYVGGDISKPNMLWYLSAGILIVLIIITIVKIFNHTLINGEDYNQRQLHRYFNNIHGELNDDDAKMAIQYGGAVENPRAIDNYRLGAVYLVNGHNPDQAHIHFNRALRQIMDNEVDMKLAPFIIERIDEFKDHFVDFPDLEDLPIQIAMLRYYETKNDIIHKIERKKPEIKDDDPEFTQKVILSRQEWQSDSQNVHDSAISMELSDQLLRVRNENAKIPGISSHNYNEAIFWLKANYKNNPELNEKLDSVLAFIDNNYPISIIDQSIDNKSTDNRLHEKDIVTTVWQRSFDPENKSNCALIKEALGNALIDCVEGGCVVCMAGRNMKVWQALATLDKDPSTGILKSKQALRNEIYDRCAKIVDEYLGISGTASEQLKDDYRKGNNTEQVQEMVNCIKQQMQQLKKEYSGLIDKTQTDLIIAECEAVV